MPRRTVQLFASIFSVVLVGPLAGCGLIGSQSFGFEGTMTLPAVAWKGDADGGRTEAGESCYFGVDGNPYPDIDAGTQVTLTDSMGAIVGISNLESGGHLFGWGPDLPRLYDDDSFVEDYCSFNFSFEDISSPDEFFSVEVGTRGAIQYSREDLEAGISVSLGD